MKYSNDVLAFLVELYKRMSLKSPKFFQILQMVGVVAALITGIPLFIQQIDMFTGLHIDLPEIVNSTLIRIVFWCGLIVKLMAKLPVTNPETPVTTDGKRASPARAMPFTEKNS